MFAHNKYHRKYEFCKKSTEKKGKQLCSLYHVTDLVVCSRIKAILAFNTDLNVSIAITKITRCTQLKDLFSIAEVKRQK